MKKAYELWMIFLTNIVYFFDKYRPCVCKMIRIDFDEGIT
jgi:hypothetical protein